MFRFKKRLEWGRRTLTGYTVMHVGVDRTWTVKHRPFKQPLMTSEKTPAKSMRGMEYKGILFDETSPLTEEQVNDLVKLSKGLK